MSEIKLFEVRDRGTCMPVLAIRPEGTNDGENFVWGRAGYGRTPGTQKTYTILCDLSNPPGTLNYDDCEWDNRTLKIAHDYIALNWSALESGQVVDIEHVTGEAAEPKLSERFGGLVSPMKVRVKV